MVLQFENLTALWGFVPILTLIAVALWRGKRSAGGIAWKRLILSATALALGVLALARPQLGERVTSSQKASGNLFLLVDVSQSMLATDTTPSRMQFAVEFLRKLLPQVAEVRVAVFPFANNGFLQLPLTSDIFAAMDTLEMTNPSITTDQGSNLNQGLKALFQRISQTEEKIKEKGGSWTTPRILLISDGESHQPVEKEILALYLRAKIPVFTVGVGTEAGTRLEIPTQWNGLAERSQSAQRKPIHTKLDSKTLREIAQATGGDFFPGRFTEIPKLASRLTQSLQVGKLQSTFKLKREFFPYLLLATLFLFLLDFSSNRWRYVLRGGLLLFLVCGAAPNAEARNKIDPEIAAIQKFNEGVKESATQNYRRAAELFEEAALLSPDPLLRKKSLFNLGNTSLKMGEAEQALQFYQQAYDSKLDPSPKKEEIQRRITENMELAAQVQKQQQSQASKGKPSEDPNDKGKSQDPGGPQKYESQEFSDEQKNKIWDLVAGEERQAQERMRDQGKRGSGQSRAEKPW